MCRGRGQRVIGQINFDFYDSEAEQGDNTH